MTKDRDKSLFTFFYKILLFFNKGKKFFTHTYSDIDVFSYLYNQIMILFLQSQKNKNAFPNILWIFKRNQFLRMLRKKNSMN